MSDHFAYAAIREDAEGRSFACGSKEYVNSVVDKWRAGERSNGDEELDEEPELPLTTSKQEALSAALKRAVAFGLSQEHLIRFSGFARSALGRSGIPKEAIEAIKSDATKISDTDEIFVFGLNSDQYADFETKRKQTADIRLGLQSLPSAALLSLVATFDAMIVDVLGQLLKLDNFWMRLGERKLSFARLAEANSLDELLAEAISEEVYQFSRGSHDEQVRYIESTFGLSVRAHWKRWADYIEVFERRNLIAHGEASFNKRYVAICVAAGHKGSAQLLGDRVELRQKYLLQALDVLLEFSILLPFMLWKKLAKDQEEQAFEQLNETAYTLIQNGRYIVAERVLEFALELKNVKVSASTIQMLTINRASSLRHAGLTDQAKKVLDTIDWSASSDIFRICMHSVRGEANEVAKLLGPLKAASKIDATSFKRWPCFSFVREDEAVKSAFEEAFGEPIKITGHQLAVDSPPAVEVVVEPNDSDGSTLH